MKKLTMIVGVFLVCLFAMNVQAGQVLGPGNQSPGIAQPHSNAFGKSLDDWMRTYLEWLAAGADPGARVRNVGFLPILGGPEFTVEVESGTALVLPVATWLGYPNEDPLPDDWFGDKEHIFGEVTVDKRPAVELDENYYVGPSYFNPPLILFDILEIQFYQALVCVINPLSPGQHTIKVHSGLKDFGAEYNNTWEITVLPRNEK